jgi:WD domain, G-beta repeat
MLLRSRQQIAQVTFSGAGEWLAAACWDTSFAPGEAVIWRTGAAGQTPVEAGRLAHLDGVLYTAFSDSGQTIATASEDQTAMIWHRNNGAWEPALRPLRCGGQVFICSFSHNGRWLATASRTPEAQGSRAWNSDIRIWDVANGEPVSLPVVLPEKVTRLAFVASDTHLFIERWLPPAAPQRWLIDLAVKEGAPEDFLLWTELLSAQRSFLGGRAPHPSQALEGGLSAEEVLVHASGVGPLRPLTKNDCRELWLHLSGRRVAAPTAEPAR